MEEVPPSPRPARPDVPERDCYQPLAGISDLGRDDWEGRNVAQIIGESLNPELNIFARLLARFGDVKHADHPPVSAVGDMPVGAKTPSLSVPADALIFNRNGMQVAVVDNDKAEIRKVRVTRNLGTRVEVDSGIKAGDRVILNPPVTLIDGSKVQVRPEADGQRHADLQAGSARIK